MSEVIWLLVRDLTTIVFKIAFDPTLTDADKEQRLRRAGEVIMSEAASDKILDELLRD